MVLVSALTDSALFHGTMHRMLETETALTSRVGHLPDSYSFSAQGFVKEEVDMASIIFGASEYVKDGLLPLTEYMGPHIVRDGNHPIRPGRGAQVFG